MKREIKKIITDWGRRPSDRLARPARLEQPSDFERLSKRLEERSIHLAPHSLRRLWKWVSAAKPEKPSQRTLDRLALFAGFQDWKDLQKALHGTNDAALNYKD